MTMPGLVRLSDGCPACAVTFAMDAPPGAWLPDAMQSLICHCKACDPPADVSAQIVLASSAQQLHSVLVIRLRMNDPHADLQVLTAAQRRLESDMRQFFAAHGIACRPSAPEHSALALLPDAPPAFLHRSRIPPHAASSASANSSFARECEAVSRALRRAPGSGVSLVLSPCEPLSGSDPEPLYACAAFMWGGAARAIADLLRAAGLPLRVQIPARDPVLAAELTFDPWALHRRLSRSFGNDDLALTATSLTHAALSERFCS